MSKIICIGSTSKDIFFPTKEGIVKETPEDTASQKKIIFELGAKYHINDRFESLGGCAANQAVALSRLGMDVSLYTSLGDDNTADWIRKELAKENIRKEMIDIEKGSLSGLSAIVVDESSGDRIIFSNQEANEKLKVKPEKLVGADFVSVTDLSGDWKSVVETVLDFCGKNGIKIAYNPRGKNIQEDPQKVFELAGKCEIFFVNKDEAIEIMGNKNQEVSDLNNEEYLLKELKNSGAKIVVITDGKRGAWASDGERVVHADALVKKAVDMTGAGDAFASAFLAAHIKGKKLEECLGWGIKNGGNVVKFYGGVEGLLREADII